MMNFVDFSRIEGFSKRIIETINCAKNPSNRTPLTECSDHTLSGLMLMWFFSESMSFSTLSFFR
jgi:hypothetical protein